MNDLLKSIIEKERNLAPKKPLNKEKLKEAARAAFINRLSQVKV